MAKKVPVYGLDGKAVKKIELPPVFDTPLRLDVIRRVIAISWSRSKQPQGRDPLAGKRTTAESWGVGYGIARIPRIKGARHPAAGRGALVAGTVGGRQAHPPRAEKYIKKKVNKKEKALAVMSAIAATADPELVRKRGHRIDDVPSIPLVVTDEFESISKTAEAREVFKALGLWDDVERVRNSVKVRAGKGKMRGRRLKKAKGPLVVVSSPDASVIKAVKNFPGVDVVSVDNLGAEMLAPGAHPGRLALWSVSAIDRLSQRFG